MWISDKNTVNKRVWIDFLLWISIDFIVDNMWIICGYNVDNFLRTKNRLPDRHDSLFSGSIKL